MRAERVTVTFPPHMILEIDRLESNRSKFIQQAVRRELERCRREALRESLENPHPESAELAHFGLADWAQHIPAEAVDELLDPGTGREVRWIHGDGWSEV